MIKIFFVEKLENETFKGKICVRDPIKYPHQVSIHDKELLKQKEDSYKCGGSIISSYYVLSAAHCFLSETKKYIVIVGSLYHNNGGIYKVCTVIKHPEFESLENNMQKNDIALIRVKDSFVFSNLVNSINFYNKKLDYINNLIGTIIGWGVNCDGNLPDCLQEIEVPIIKERIPHNSRVFIAGYSKKYEEKCADHGDSGSPFLIDGKLAGIVSFSGRRSGKIFLTEVLFYQEWISETTKRIEHDKAKCIIM